MTLGEHLDELRGCVVRCLVALLVACLLCAWPARFLLELIARPVVIALRHHGQPDSFLQTYPVEGLLVYIKVVLIFGMLLAGPYILYQLWGFVASGLYEKEKRWVFRLIPPSVGLFLLGVVFMYVLVLPVSLNFLVGFSGWLPLPESSPTALERLMLGIPLPAAPATQPTWDEAARVPLLMRDPVDAPVGALWMNVNEGKLKVHLPDEVKSVQLIRDDQRALMTTHFKIGEYLSFVLVLMVAFGVAFQLPLVVLFLVRSGILAVEQLRKYRKIVILLIVVVAGILAPPDLLSHLLLSVPMYLLFEAGLLLAARGPQGAPRASRPPTGA